MLRDLFSLFPAYAGVIPVVYSYHCETDAFPRICGGDPYVAGYVTKKLYFSPHMRG